MCQDTYLSIKSQTISHKSSSKPLRYSTYFKTELTTFSFFSPTLSYEYSQPETFNSTSQA